MVQRSISASRHQPQPHGRCGKLERRKVQHETEGGEESTPLETPWESLSFSGTLWEASSSDCQCLGFGECGVLLPQVFLVRKITPPDSNHLYAMKVLKKATLKGRKEILPAVL